MKHYFLVFVGVGVLMLYPGFGFAQELRPETGAIAAALRHARESIPAGSQVKYEVRNSASQLRQGEFDSARSEAVHPAVSDMDVGRREDILVCKGRPDTCRLAVNHLLSVTGASPGRDANVYDVLVEVRESTPQNKRQPVQLKRVLITVKYSNGRWAVTNERVVSVS